MFCLADVSCIAKRCLFVVYILLFEGGLEGVERIGAFEECAADDMVGGRQRDGEFVFLRIEFGVLDVREPERLVGYGAFFHHGNRDQVAVDGDFPALSDELACLHDLAHGERQQGESADHEDDRRGSGAQDGHAADADAERIYQGYYPFVSREEKMGVNIKYSAI